MTQLQIKDLFSRSSTVGALGTFIFFLLFGAGCIFVKAKPQVQYKTIQIQLESTPVAKKAESQKSEKNKAPVKDIVTKNQPKPVEKVQPKPVEKPASKVNQKPAETKQEYTPPKLKKSVEELMAEQNAPKKEKVWDDSLFMDDFVESTSIAVAKAPSSAAKSSLEGSAGARSSSTSGQISSSNAKPVNNSVSSNTSQALADVSNTSYNTTVSDNAVSKTSIKSTVKNGRVTLQMADGKLRELISPKKPVIFISEENASLIQSTRTVKILFKVSGSGKVLIQDIDIKPAALLPLAIQNEIKEQISEWTFTADPGNLPGLAEFDYTLEIK